LRASGGNPGGYITFVDLAGAPVGNPGMIAPSPFLGSYAVLGTDIAFEFDARTETATGHQPGFTLTGPGGEAFFSGSSGIGVGFFTGGQVEAPAVLR
jgi:hypothetical protein